MSTRSDIDRSIEAWLIAEASGRAPDDVLEASRRRLRATRQRRLAWPAWRSNQMNSYAKLAAAAAAVLVVAVVGYQLLPGRTGSNAGASVAPSAQASPLASPTGSPAATSRVVTVRPFAPPEGFGMCPEGVGTACVEDPKDDTISITYVLPDGWNPHENLGAYVDQEGSDVGASVLFNRGNWLLSEPCRPVDDTAAGDIPVGPTVDDFVTALVDHPDLDVTAPVATTLAGYSGKYVDLFTPTDRGDCDTWRPIDEHIYAQGRGERWHMWVLDVDGVRVLIEMTDYAATSDAWRQQAQGMLDSLVIRP
jgi:hypothetical protein